MMRKILNGAIIATGIGMCVLASSRHPWMAREIFYTGFLLYLVGSALVIYSLEPR